MGFDYGKLLSTISNELPLAAAAAHSVETLAGDAPGDQKLNAAVEIAQSGLVGWAVADSSKAEGVQVASENLPNMVKLAVGIFNAIGLFRHHKK